MRVHYSRLRRAILNIVSRPSIPFLFLLLILVSVASLPAHSSNPQQTSPYTEPRWMAKMRANQAGTDSTSSGVKVFANVDVSNERGPQSETFIALDTQSPKTLAGGSNEIFRNPLRAYFSTNDGNSWVGADLPLVDEEGTRWSFASDPGVAVDTRGTIFFSQLQGRCDDRQSYDRWRRILFARRDPEERPQCGLVRPLRG